MKKASKILFGLALLASTPVNGQESKGVADVSAQGYYSPGTPDAQKATTGVTAHFRYILSGGMLLEGKAENYAASGLRLTENYLTLRGVAAGAWRLEFSAGDISVPGRQIDIMTPQVYTPFYRLRGAQVQGLRGRLGWKAYTGLVTFLEGPRLPFSILGPQGRSGGGITWKASESLEFAGQTDTISTSPETGTDRPYLLQPGRRFARTVQTSGMASWKPRKGLSLFSEVALTYGSPMEATTQKPSPWNALSVADYDGGRYALRGSYFRQSAGYMPVAGYYSGDRGGGAMEGRARPWKRIEFFSSAGKQRNNFENNPAVWTFQTTMANAGVSAEAPGGFSFTAQYSTMSLVSQAPGDERIEAANRQWMLTGAKSYWNQTTRLSWRKFDMNNSGNASAQGSAEAEQSMRFGRWTASGAVRWSQARFGENRDSVFVRAMVQGTARRATFHAYTELGRDLANQTLFTVNQLQTTVAGISMPVGRSWSVHADVLRTTIATILNPQSAFVLAANGAPVSLALGGLDRLNIFFRVTRHLSWGGPAPQSGYAASLSGVIPVFGAIEGFVRDDEGAAVQSIPVLLDGYRTAYTDERGRYRLPDVMQGQHSIELSPRELPAEYDPASVAGTAIQVRSAKTERLDFQLVRLLALHGQVLAPPNSKLDEIVIRLQSGNRVTTPDQEGRFAFYNLPAGEYTVVIDESTLPSDRRLSGEGSLRVSLRRGEEPVEAIFGLEAVTASKPVRRIDLGGLAAAPGSASRKATDNSKNPPVSPKGRKGSNEAAPPAKKKQKARARGRRGGEFAGSADSPRSGRELKPAPKRASAKSSRSKKSYSVSRAKSKAPGISRSKTIPSAVSRSAAKTKQRAPKVVRKPNRASPPARSSK